MLKTEITQYLNSLSERPFTLAPERIEPLNQLVSWLTGQYQQGITPSLNFICTHNSRRSHLGQFWGKVIPVWLEMANTQTYSGGTQVTACHPNTMAAIGRAGAKIIKQSDGINPHYACIPDDSGDELIHFWSKLYNDIANPTANFAAIMTCTSADEACPFISGASVRISLPFLDPKYADGSPEMESAYNATSDEIALTLIYAFKKVKAALK